jgi:hypothetical protein
MMMMCLIFEAGKPVRRIAEGANVPKLQGKDIWALVDGDVDDGRPHPGLINKPKVRIVMASSPKTRDSRKWMKQAVCGAAMIYMKTWSVDELLFVGCVLLFLLL